MSDLARLKASVADLTARVKNATTVEAGVATLVQAMADQNKQLADKIAGMSPETVTQADLDALSGQVSDLGTALDQGTAALAKAAAYDPTNPAAGNSGSQSGVSGAGIGSSGVGLTPAPSTESMQPNTAPADQPSADKPKPLAGTGADERAAAEQANPPAADVPASGSAV